MPDLEASPPCVAAAAQRLQVRQVERELGRLADGFDMVDLEPTPGAALDAGPAIPTKRLKPQRRPAWPAGEMP